MAQKTNPNALRLGSTQVWETTIQNYGKKSSIYSFSLIKHFLANKLALFHFQPVKKDMVLSKRFTIHHKWIGLNLKCSDKRSQLSKEFEKSLSLIYSKKVKIKNFHMIETYVTAEFLTSYVEYLFTKNFSLKKISLNVFIFLKTCLNMEKIIYSNNTILILNLIGFKIKISGRFDNSRNQMAKSYEQSFGSLSLVRLENYVEFYNKSIFTKLGVCGFQVWLFYKITYSDGDQ
uniref:Ribosomal protein S3 n=1 Tax=Pterocladia mexicana TaxID=1911544 RepID=A0A1D8X7R5_9FLOR|nr:ribosomal protein S3 [Pterocladia mexicana]AOX49053.1 ribosomal protein S3 [Pterocladia mexicana]